MFSTIKRTINFANRTHIIGNIFNYNKFRNGTSSLKILNKFLIPISSTLGYLYYIRNSNKISCAEKQNK